MCARVLPPFFMQIQNVVASCRITPEGTKINLKELVQGARNAEYNPKVRQIETSPRQARTAPFQPPDGALNFSVLARAPRHRQRFSAVIMRLRDPKSTALIFESGKMVVLGAKEENQVPAAAIVAAGRVAAPPLVLSYAKRMCYVTPPPSPPLPFPRPRLQRASMPRS
jgi:hypothetical protein